MLKRITALLFAAVLSYSAFAVSKVTVRKDAGGWRVFDGNTPVEIKGMVWSYTPIGESYYYDLYSKDDETIQKMIDYDMPMLRAMGVNTIRCFGDIPPKWVEYIYTKYGIYTIINDLLGRYGISVNGTWYPQTDYSDQYTREVLIEQARTTAEKYKDTKGVLMYMLGNESNYGLVWSSSEIEDLPVGDQNAVKAGYLYDLLEKAMAAVKEIDPNRPVGFINGDVGNLELIAKLCPSLDVFGVNAYRGYKFYDSFYENIADVLDKPVVLTECGADAYNDILKQEDQAAQMLYLKTQWEEIYEQSYGKGKCQNMIGGFVFEWMDEWWKRYQWKNVDVHDDASWANSGYELDYREGTNNMSEEWFGICAQSTLTDNGINVRIPRAAYYMLTDVWKLSLYDSSRADVKRTFGSLNDSMYLAKGLEKSVRQTFNEEKKFEISQLNATVQATTPVYINGLIDDLKDGKRNWAEGFRYKNGDGETNEPTVVAEANLGVKVKPFENLEGEVVLKVATGEPFTRIGDHWSCYYEDTGSLYGNNQTGEDHLKYVDVYSASFAYTNRLFDLNGYYHAQHGSFEGKGDPFCISSEGYDVIGYDTYGSKAPIAVEFIGKGLLDGLEVVGGPEIVGGAKPQVQANYRKWLPNVGPLDGILLNATGAAEFSTTKNIAVDPYNGFGGGYKASLYGETYIMPWFQLKAGLLTSGSEKIGAYYNSDKRTREQITLLDTLGAHVELGTDMFQHLYIYTKADYRGLVADTNPAMVRGGFFTADTGSGNRFELQLGADVAYGNFTFKPVIRARTPLEEPMGRCLLDGDPFVVGLGNRKAVEIEAVFTYDAEGATWFHDWNNDDVEGSPIAFSLSGLYQLYADKTDNLVYKSDAKGDYISNDGTTVTDYYWNNGGALDLQKNLFQVGARVVWNPTFVRGLRLIGNLGAGRLSASTGTWGNTQEFCMFYTGGLAARYGHWIGSVDVIVNGWGPESWWRDFNMTFPLQYTVDIAYAFNKNPSFLDKANRIGLRFAGRNFGEYSSDAYGALPSAVSKNPDGAMYMEVTTYFSIGL